MFFSMCHLFSFCHWWIECKEINVVPDNGLNISFEGSHERQVVWTNWKVELRKPLVCEKSYVSQRISIHFRFPLLFLALEFPVVVKKWWCWSFQTRVIDVCNVIMLSNQIILVSSCTYMSIISLLISSLSFFYEYCSK